MKKKMSMFGKAEEKGEPKLKGKALAREEKGEKAHKALPYRGSRAKTTAAKKAKR